METAFIQDRLMAILSSYTDVEINGTMAVSEVNFDDAALGCPLMKNKELSDRPFVNWAIVRGLLENQNILRKEHLHNFFG